MDKKITVLYVEDNPQDKRLIEEKFGELCDFIHVSSLAECHDIGKAQIALLDLNLDKTIGVETIERFRAGVPHLPVVVLTAVNDTKTHADCIIAGAHAVFRKESLNPKDLLLAMEAAIVVYKRTSQEKKEIRVHTKQIDDLERMLTRVHDRLKEIRSGGGGGR